MLWKVLTYSMGSISKENAYSYVHFQKKPEMVLFLDLQLTLEIITSRNWSLWQSCELYEWVLKASPKFKQRSSPKTKRCISSRHLRRFPFNTSCLLSQPIRNSTGHTQQNSEYFQKSQIKSQLLNKNYKNLQAVAVATTKQLESYHDRSVS